MSPPTDPRSEVFRARQLASQVGQLTLWDDPLQPTRARRSNSAPGNTGGDVETLQGGCVDPEVLAPTVSGVPSSMNIPGALRDGVVHGNALDFLPRMKDESVDLFFMSPPYADQRAYSRIHPDRYVDWFLPFARAMFDATTQSGSMVLNIKNRVAGSGPLKGQRHPYVYELVLALQHMGWRWIETYIWAKPNAIPGKFGPRTKDSFEYVYHFSRGLSPSSTSTRCASRIRATLPRSLAAPAIRAGERPLRRGLVATVPRPTDMAVPTLATSLRSARRITSSRGRGATPPRCPRGWPSSSSAA